MCVSKQGWFRFAKSEDKFIWQMFTMEDCLWSGWAEQKCSKHGSLHVILQAPERWQTALGSESQHFLKMSSQTSEERYQFFTWLKMSIPNPCVFWRWRGRGKNGFNLVAPFEPEEAGFTRWSSHWRNWQRIAVDKLTRVYCCGGQVGSKDFDRGILYCWQHFKWKCGRSFGSYPAKKCPKIRVCLRTSWTNNTVRWISGGEDVLSLAFLRLDEAEAVAETSCGKRSAVCFCRWDRQLNDTILPCTIFSPVEEVFAHNQSDRILLRYHWEQFWVMDRQMIK